VKPRFGQRKDGDGGQMTGSYERRHETYQQRYEICVRGRLGEIIRAAFPDLRARARDGNTVLSGTFADQAALYGIIAQLESLGLELIELRRVP
jgi:hypothetical protein